MRYSLRWKILLFTLIPPLTLAISTLWIVNRWVTHQAYTGVQDRLEGSASAFERLIEAESRAQAAAARTMARDPRLTHLVARASGSKSWAGEAAGAAREWYAAAPADLFEVFDVHGNRLLSAGRAISSPAGRGALVRGALAGSSKRGLIVEPTFQAHALATPLREGSHVVGVLLTGTRLDEGRARELGRLTEAQVTFVSGTTLMATTLASERDKSRLLAALADAGRETGGTAGVLLVVDDGDRHALTLVHALPGTRFSERQLLVLQRSADSQTAILRRIRSGLVQLGVLTVLVASMIGFIVSLRVTRPVQQLVRGAEEMERGNYEYPLDIKSRDELGYLAHRFLEMRERERNYVQSLQEVARLKTEFISVASHELRTPISVIKGFHDLFAQGSLGPVSDQQRQALDRIGDGLVKLVQIAEDATRMAQIESDRMVLDLGDHEVGALIERGTRAAQAEARGRSLTITVEAASDLPPARVDPERLTQAVANLVRNGIRFTPDGGRVDVRAWREPGCDRDQLLIEVRDSGIGIPEDRMSVLFNRTVLVRDSLNHHSSSRLEFNSAGLGLGLPIARGIVEAHGGTIEATSRPGEGTRFLVRIPYGSGEALRRAG